MDESEVSVLLDVEKIRTDGGTQARAELDRETVAEYVEVYNRAQKEGFDGTSPFPDVIVFYDGEAHWLADGFHRTAAARRAGWFQVSAEIRQGTRRDAVLFAAGANASHGLRRSQADKRRAVETLLRDDEWGKWSDREIARRCRVSHPTVAAVRAELEKLTGKFTSERTYVDRHGNTGVMETERIGNGQQSTGNGERVDRADYGVAYEWLGNYVDDTGRRWHDLETNQIVHANSPCYQAFVAEFPDLSNPKQYLKDSLARLQRAAQQRLVDDSPHLAEYLGETFRRVEMVNEHGQNEIRWERVENGEQLTVNSEQSTADKRRWIDTMEPVGMHKRQALVVAKIRPVLFRAACQHDYPNGALREWAEDGPEHPGWPASFGLHPTTPDLLRYVADELRGLMEYGILQGTGAVAAVDCYVWSSPVSTESLIGRLARGDVFDVCHAERATGLPGEQIIEAAQWLLKERFGVAGEESALPLHPREQVFALRQAAARLAGGLNVEVVGVSCIAALAQAMTQLDRALAAYDAFELELVKL